MTQEQSGTGEPRVLQASLLGGLLEGLLRRNYDVVGPTVRNGAVVLDRIRSPEDLPRGWTDEQTPGHYRLKSQEDQAFFAYATGPHSWKNYLHPAEVKLWAAERENGTFRILNNEVPAKRPLAFFGVKSCDLAAIAIQDHVLAGDVYHDSIYSERRKDAFVIVVQCTHPAETCFCASLGTGPAAKRDFDVSLTELVEPETHYCIIRAGSERGAALISELQTTPASEEQLERESVAIERAARQQTRRLDPTGLKELLYQSFENPCWEKIASRCLGCANCTMVCPTCFCATIEDTSDLTGTRAERWRRWDSCFTLSFSYIHGGSVRASAGARYRQWMTHKLASWIDQFGTLGCVGCGRCIVWCPKGIDLTEEAHALQEGDNHGNA